MKDISMPMLTAKKMSTAGALRLYEKNLSESSNAYISAYMEYLDALESEKPSRIEKEQSNLKCEERLLRQSPLVRAVVEDMDDLVNTLRKKAIKKYKRRMA